MSRQGFLPEFLETCLQNGQVLAQSEKAGFFPPLKDKGRFLKSRQVFYDNHGKQIAPHCRSVMDRLQNAVPVAKGPGFLQLSVQLQSVLQPKVPSSKGLALQDKMGCGNGTCLLRPLLRRNQYCNEGCKKNTLRAYLFALQLFMQPYSRAKNNKEKTRSINTKSRKAGKEATRHHNITMSHVVLVADLLARLV